MAIVDSYLGAGAVAGELGLGWRQRAVAAATRLYPFLSGCGRLSRSPLIDRLAGPISGDAWVDVDAGRLFLPLEDSIARSILFTGDHDRRISGIASRAASGGDVALDVGARFGSVAATLSRAVGAYGVVHAFEPDPVSARYLRRSLDGNGMDNVVLHRVSVGAVERQAERVAAIDAMFDVDEPIAFMRVDGGVDGRAVLAGAAAKLDNRSIHAVLVCGGSGAALASRDYDVFAVPRRMTRMRFIPLAEARATRCDARDHLAVARGPETQALRVRLGIA